MCGRPLSSCLLWIDQPMCCLQVTVHGLFSIVRKSFDVHRTLTFSWRTTGDVDYIKCRVGQDDEFESKWSIGICKVKLVYWDPNTISHINDDTFSLCWCSQELTNCSLNLLSIYTMPPTPYHTSLHIATLHYTTLHYTTLHYTTLHYTTLHYTTSRYTTLH